MTAIISAYANEDDSIYYALRLWVITCLRPPTHISQPLLHLPISTIYHSCSISPPPKGTNERESERSFISAHYSSFATIKSALIWGGEKVVIMSRSVFGSAGAPVWLIAITTILRQILASSGRRTENPSAEVLIPSTT